MPLSAYLHEIPRPFWIVALVLGFVWHWPIGLAVLAYLIGSGRIGRRGCAPGRWYNTQAPTQGMPGDGGGWGWGPGGRFNVWGGLGQTAAPASSNRAFDEYRAETLRRLEEEQKEFMDYLERLRQARDKQEFDQFMAERRRGSPPMDVPPAA